MRPLGVGLVYWPALAPLFEAGHEQVSVLELEPQTLWEKYACGDSWQYRVNEGLLQQVAQLPQHKLVHGVGQPLGGLCEDPLDWRTPWARCAQALRPAWASEHLSFNRFRLAGAVEQTSFLLPPRQSAVGVAVAARNIAQLRKASGVPVAFETGVNYLQPRADELPDGDYFAQVAEAADCGILLDLHNLWVNERNGRCSVARVLDALPLHRVWELHLAGGSLLNGYWLDAHDRLADPELLALAAQLMPRLPNLGALMFEILPQYIPGVGLDHIARQLEQLAALWRLRPARQVHVPPQAVSHWPGTPGADVPAAALAAALADALADVQAWEHTLGTLALGRPLPQGMALPGLADDPGRLVFEQLVHEFRCGRIVRVMHYTVLVLLRGLGPQGLNALMQSYCRNSPSDIFTAAEADHFANYLRQQMDGGQLRLPWLGEVLAFEHAMIRASLRGEASALDWSVDPTLLFAALESGDGLDTLPPLSLRMEVQAEIAS